MQLCDFNFPVFWEHVFINEVFPILSRFISFYLIVYVIFKVIFLRDVTVSIRAKVLKKSFRAFEE